MRWHSWSAGWSIGWQKAHVGAMTLADLDDATGDRTDLLADQVGYVGMRTRLSEQS
jgi:hypothetical protein